MSEINKIRANRLAIIQEYALYAWAFSIFFSAFNFMGYIFIGLSLIKMIGLREYKKFRFSKEKIAYFFLMLFVIWNLITLLYSENTYEGIKQLEKKIPLFLVSVLGLFSKTERFKTSKVLNFYIHGIVFAVLVALLYSFYMFFEGHLGAIAIIKGFNQVNLLYFFNHRLYIGVLLLMGIPIIIESFLNYKSWVKKLYYLLLLGVILYIIYSSGARILVICALFTLIVILLIKIRFRITKAIFALVLFFTIAISLTIIYFHPRTKLTIDLIQKRKPLQDIDNRFVTWDNAINIIVKNPLLGIGIGDSKSEMLKSYEKNGNVFELENRFNVHNQYLQTILETGIIGVFLFFLFSFSLFFIQSNKKMLLLAFIIIFGTSFSIESMLSRDLGTFKIAFWVFVLISTKNEIEARTLNSKNKDYFLKIGGIFSLFLLLGMIFWSKNKKFNKTNPSTYMTLPFTRLSYDNLPNKDGLPEKTDASSFKRIDDFRIFERGFFIAPEVYTTNKDVPVEVHLGIWCYLSKDTNINEAYVFAWDRVNVSYRKKYNLNEKGTWQYLELNSKPFSNSFSLGVRIDILKNSSEVEGTVLFALPQYKIDYK